MSKSELYLIDGVAVLTLDNPPVNSLSGAERLRVHTQLREAARRDDVKAIVLIGLGRAFCGGAEISEFNTPAQRQSPTMPELIEGCDTIPKIMIAAIDGFAFGAGLELALAFHYRVATPGAMLGLPEVKFGFLPGAGGTQRLPRLVPMVDAAKMILTGKPITAEAGLTLGLVDNVVDGDLEGEAIALAHALIASGAPLRRTRDLPPKVQGTSQGFFDELRADVVSRERGNVAKLHIIDCCIAAREQPFAVGLQFERERFLSLLNTPESAALRHVFLAERRAAKLTAVGTQVQAREIRQCAVIGAGTMGGGIAMCFANAGIKVTLIDANLDALDRCITSIVKNYGASMAKGRLTKSEMVDVIGLIVPARDPAAAADADIVVEAVFENLILKQEIFKRLTEITRPGTILATNTSMLDVNAIAESTSRPEDVVGMHFFSPAHVMRLLEVVGCSSTSDEVLLTVMRLGRKLGKTPVLSGVCDGFIGNRMLQRYLQQSLFLLDEGCSIQQIDRAMENWGMAMGPFVVSDLSGLDVGWSIRKRRYVERPEFIYSRAADRICEAGRLGQKNGHGWYRYENGSRNPLVDPDAHGILAQYRSEIDVPQRQISDDEIVQRLVLALVNEGALILGEGIAQRSSDIDVVYTTGYGFPAVRGGPMFYGNTIGLDKVIAEIRTFQHGYQGDQWQPAPLLLELAAAGRQFG